MWKTVVYIVLLLIGFVGYAYSVYVEVRNNKLQKEGKENRKKAYLTEIIGGLSIGLIAVPVIELTEKLLSQYITSEAALFFLQMLSVVVVLLVIGIPVRRIAKR